MSRAVLVTGASRGIGRAVAQAFAEAGDRVAVHWGSSASEAQRTLASLPGDGHVLVQADLADAEQVRRAVDDAARALGGLDVLVNNAGVFLASPPATTPWEQWQQVWTRTVAVNLSAAAHATFTAVPHLAAGGGGAVINVSSRGAFRGEPDCPSYGASKAGLNAFGQSMAVALAPLGIAVSTVAPGFVETDMAAEVLDGPRGDEVRAQSPFGRVATPQEVAAAVCWLASPQARFASGDHRRRERGLVPAQLTLLVAGLWTATHCRHAGRRGRRTVTTTYLVTGGTGFLGRHLLARLVRRPDAEVHVLVRRASAGRLEQLAAVLDGGERIRPLIGDIREDLLGLTQAQLRDLKGVDHVVHLAALYDMTADAADNEDLNVGGTRRAVAVADRLGAGCFHHVSSVAVAGEHRGRFTEDMFDEGQELPSAYHATKFVAERVVREDCSVPWRVYRPVVVVGDSRTGQMDKVDGPYYFLPFLTSLGDLPAVGRVPLVLPDLGDTNVVPVDYVADAMDALIHEPGLDGRAFHLAHPRMQPLLDIYNALASAAGAPRVAVGLTRRLLPPVKHGLSLIGRVPGISTASELVAARLGIPPSVLPHSTFRPEFSSERTREVLDRLGVEPPPEFASYAPVLYGYWADHLDPLRARRRPAGGELEGRTVVVTGASSGIGRETALLVAARGGIPLLVARRTEELDKVREEIEAAGGRAGVYSVDLTDEESVDSAVKQMLADHHAIDMLVNNAGRSIRRSIELSYDRFHDFERTMALNYFAPVRLVLRLLPHMTDRRFGHIVNVSSIGVQANPPRFSAYVASKAALDAFSRVAATEMVGRGVTFTNIHMPLVRTPMIAPTGMYDKFPTLSPQQAAEMIVGALEDKPKHVGTTLGTVAVVATALAPKVVDAVLHTAYLLFPDSTAAGGDASSRTATPEALSRGAVVVSRLLPGVHW